MSANCYSMSFDSVVTRSDGEEAVRLEIARVVRIAGEQLEGEDKGWILKSAELVDLPPLILRLYKCAVKATVFVTWQRAVN